MFRRKELQELLLKELSTLLSKNGFEFRPREQGFRASRPDGSALFHLSFIPHAADFDIIADVTLRFDAVEDLLNEVRPYLSKTEKKLTATIGSELGQFLGGMQQRWTVASGSDVKSVAASIYDAFLSIALPFLKRYSDLDTLLAVLSSNHKLARLLSPSNAGRWKTVLALASLLGKFDEIESLITQAQSYLASLSFLNSKKEFDDFQQFAARIRQLMETQRLGKASAP